MFVGCFDQLDWKLIALSDQEIQQCTQIQCIHTASGFSLLTVRIGFLLCIEVQCTTLLLLEGYQVCQRNAAIQVYVSVQCVWIRLLGGAGICSSGGCLLYTSDAADE